MTPKFRRGLLTTGLFAVSFALVAACSTESSNGNGSGSETTNIVYSTYVTAESDQGQAITWWADELETRTDGQVTVELNFSEQLVGAEDTLPAINDGRVDAGQVASLYASGAMPLTSVSDVPFVTTNSVAQAYTILDMVKTNDRLASEFEEGGLQIAFPFVIGPNVIGTSSTEVSSLDDLRGMQIRAGGEVAKAARSIGANPVDLTANEIYQALQSGVADGYTSVFLATITNFGLEEVTDYVVDSGVGVYSSSLNVVNRDLYESLSEEDQEIFDEVSFEAVAKSAEALVEEGLKACDILLERGTQVTALDESEVEEWRSSLDLRDEWIEAHDAEDFFASYEETISQQEEERPWKSALSQCVEKSSSQ